MLGYDPIRIIMIVSLGSAFGSGFTYMLGRYFAQTRFVRKRFPNLENYPWAKGKSFLVISFLFCFGTLLPIPIDLFFTVCGAKKYPLLLFLLFVFIGKVMTYAFFVYGWVCIKALGIF